MRPSADPTSDPTKDPSANPSAEPTRVPSIIPSADPTSDPTNGPSAEPTTEPTKEPTADPTRVPSIISSADPTTSPSTATNHITFDVRIDIEYGVSALSEADKKWLTDSASRTDAVSLFTLLAAVFARNYVDAGNGVAYADFALSIRAVNGMEIEDLNVDDLARSFVIISVEIECDDSVGEIFIARSQTTGSDASFPFQVQSDLRALFNNSAIAFEVLDADELTETEMSETAEQATNDSNALYLTVIVALSLALVICAVTGALVSVYFRKKARNAKNVTEMAKELELQMTQGDGDGAGAGAETAQ